jgi:tetratricopeptide (TPR) repeat protein
MLLKQCLGQPVSLETQEVLCRRLGWMQRLTGDVAGAVDRSEMALSYARQIGNTKLEGINLGNLGSILREQGRYSEALDHIQQALALHREVKDRINEAIDLGKLGQIHQDQGRPDVALDYLMHSVALSREMGNADSASIDLANIALLHRSQGRLKEALEYFQQALSVSRELGNRRSEGVTLGNLGDLMLSMGDVESAADYLVDAIAINDETLPMAAGAFRGSLAVILAEQGEMDEARTALVKGESQLRGVHKMEYGKFLCKKARVHHLAGDDETAQVALQAAKMLADEVKVGPESEFRQAIQSAEAVILGRDV